MLIGKDFVKKTGIIYNKLDLWNHRLLYNKSDKHILGKNIRKIFEFTRSQRQYQNLDEEIILRILKKWLNSPYLRTINY